MHSSPDIRFQLPEINTWRLAEKNIDQNLVRRMVQQWEAHGYRFGCVCIDDGWMKRGLLGDWTPDPVRFPDLRELVDWIHERGYAVRLWAAPAQIHPCAETFAHVDPSWLLRNRDGQPFYYHGLGTFRLDTRQPDVRAHVKATMQRMVRDYAIDGFKLDFPPFYRPDDEFYIQQGFDFSDHDKTRMVTEFYQLIRESLDEVNPDIRVECVRPLSGCEPFVDDVISGDLMGHDRSPGTMMATARRLHEYAGNSKVVPWLEMVWGNGSNEESLCTEWTSGYLEYMAISVNYNLKLEHSFQPFSYPNNDQIRTLSNLYGPRLNNYKVIAAGRHCWSIAELLSAGVPLDAHSRLLVATDDTQVVHIQVGELHTNAYAWKAREVLSGTPVPLRARNEFWGRDLEHCRITFQAEAGKFYELWHDGPVDASHLEAHATYASTEQGTRVVIKKEKDTDHD